MDEPEVRTRKIKLDHEKMEYISFAYNEEITYWKRVSLDRVLNGRKRIGRFSTPPSPDPPPQEFY